MLKQNLHEQNSHQFLNIFEKWILLLHNVFVFFLKYLEDIKVLSGVHFFSQ